MQWIYSLWNVVPTELPSLQCNMRRYSERDGNKANNFATLCRKLMSHSQKIKTGGKFYVHSHQDHLWSNYILTVVLYKIKSNQSLTLYVPIHLLELMLYDWNSKDKNWGRGEKQLICTQRMYFATHIYQSPICETLGLVWEREKNTNKKRIIDSWRHL